MHNVGGIAVLSAAEHADLIDTSRSRGSCHKIDGPGDRISTKERGTGTQSDFNVVNVVSKYVSRTDGCVEETLVNS